MLSTVSEEDKAKLMQVLGDAEGLKTREAAVQKAFEDHRNKKTDSSQSQIKQAL